MIIKVNDKEINVSSVVSTKIQKNGKSYPALKFIFEGEITAEDVAALSSGEIEIGGTTYEGYTSLGEISMIVGKITTAEEELDEAREVIEIMTGDSNLTAEQAQEQREVIEVAVQSLPDNDALTVKHYYPTWEECVSKGTIEYDKPGYKFTYGEDLYSCVNANPTFQADWIPGIDTASLYTRIDETHAGTINDPIPYDSNMALEEGKYYSQNGVTYRCIRSTGAPVYNPLADLINIYVEIA